MNLNLNSTFKSIALAGIVATTPMVANETPASESSKTPSHQVPVSRQAYNASKNLGVVGVFVNRAHDVEESEKEIKELIAWLLKEEGIKNYLIVTHQASTGVTNFRIFVDKESKQYTFTSIENGIKVAKNDIENSIRAAKHEATIRRNHN